MSEILTSYDGVSEVLTSYERNIVEKYKLTKENVLVALAQHSDEDSLNIRSILIEAAGIPKTAKDAYKKLAVLMYEKYHCDAIQVMQGFKLFNKDMQLRHFRFQVKTFLEEFGQIDASIASYYTGDSLRLAQEFLQIMLQEGSIKLVILTPEEIHVPMHTPYTSTGKHTHNNFR